MNYDCIAFELHLPFVHEPAMLALCSWNLNYFGRGQIYYVGRLYL